MPKQVMPMRHAVSRTLIPACLLSLPAGCFDAPTSPTRLESAANQGAPRVVSSLTATAVSSSRIDLAWPDNSTREYGWEVHRSINAAPYVLIAGLTENSVAYSDNGLAGFTEHCYKVRSFRMAGKNRQYDAFSSVGCARTLGAPTGVNAVPVSSTAVDVTWVDGANNETGFRIERAPSESGPWTAAYTAWANTVRFTDYSRTPDERVCYRVVGQYGGGAEAPSAVDCTVPPRVPTNVMATPGTHSITVSWTDASVAEDGYEVRRGGGNQPWAVLATLPANSTSYVNAAVAIDTRYFYTVRARRDGGYSEESPVTSAAVPSAPPPAPVIYSAGDGSTAAKIGWPGVSANTETIRVERSLDGVSGWEPVGSAGVSDGSLRDTGRTTEQQICHRAYASNALGESGASNVACTTLLAGPTNLEAQDNGDGTFTLTWTDNSQLETYYLASISTCRPPDYYCEPPGSYVYLDANTTAFYFVPEGFEVVSIFACNERGCSDAVGFWPPWGLTSARVTARAARTARNR